VRFGAHDGLLFGLGAAPVIVAASYLLSSAARAGSLVDRSDRWLAASVGGALIAGTGLLSLREWGHHLVPGAPPFPLVALMGLGVCCAALIGAVLARRLARLSPTEMAEAFLDLGLGETQVDVELPRGTPYRDGLRRGRIVGDRDRARAVCERNLRSATLALLLAGIAVFVRAVA
jgi:hypothetical protein